MSASTLTFLGLGGVVISSESKVCDSILVCGITQKIVFSVFFSCYNKEQRMKHCYQSLYCFTVLTISKISKLSAFFYI